MTYVTGLFEQLYKIWPDTINSGNPEHRSTLNSGIEGFDPGPKCYQGGSTWGSPLCDRLLRPHPANEVQAGFHFLPWETPFNLQETRGDHLS